MRQKDEMERTENARARSNRHILWLTYGIAALFIAMAVYFGWFIQFKSENVIGSSYNARLDLLSDRVTRGSIMSNDKTVLAQTNIASDGSEKRYYPYDYLFVHSVGYSGKNGKTGLESLANFYLLSSHVNLIEKTINEFQGKKNLGDNVITTLDVDLQQTASDAIGKHRGAVIVMEPDTGKILTMVSQPNFNANLVDERWAELISPDNTKAQLVNRATQGLYPPGSTFKMLTVLEYMKENPNTWQDYVYNCNGSYQNGDYTIKCYHGTAHGAQNLIQAFANSCNGAFAEIGMQINSEKFRALANQMLFNSELPIQSMLSAPVTTGIPSFSTTRMKTSCAAPIRIPFPALITGRLEVRTFSMIARAVSFVTRAGSFARNSPFPAVSSGISDALSAAQPVPPAS